MSDTTLARPEVIAASSLPAPAVRPCDCAVCTLKARVTAAVLDARFSRDPMQLNLLGIRRRGSINSDQFDDRMAAFFVLPDARCDGARLERAVESALREELESAAAALKDAGVVRVVRCTDGGGERRWVFGLFAISTDPGRVASRELRDQLTALRREREENELALKEIRGLEAELKEGMDEVSKLSARLANRRLGKPLTPAELAKIGKDVQAARRAIEERRRRLGTRPASVAFQKAIETLAAADAKIAAREKAVEAEEQKAAAAREAADRAKGRGGAREDQRRASAAADAEARARASREALPADRARLQTGAAQTISSDMSKRERAASTWLDPKSGNVGRIDDMGKVERGEPNARFEKYYDAVVEEPEGWVGEGRALFPTGFHPEIFRVGLHLAGTHDKAQPALTVGIFDGWRVCTGAFLRRHYLSLFEGAFPKVSAYVRGDGRRIDLAPPATLEAWQTAGGPRYWVRQGDGAQPIDATTWLALGRDEKPRPAAAIGVDALSVRKRFPVLELRRGPDAEAIALEGGRMEVVLERKGDGPAVDAWLQDAEGKRLELADDDRVVIRAKIGGTNVHRGHSTSVGADGRVHAAGEYSAVSNWSVGCQVFRKFDEFNLFIRLCAASKRWRCSASAGWPPPPPPQPDAAQLRRNADRLGKDATKAEAEAQAKAEQLNKTPPAGGANPVAARAGKFVTREAVEAASDRAKKAREAATKADGEARAAEQADQTLLCGCAQIKTGHERGDAGVGGKQVAKLWRTDPVKHEKVIFDRTALFMHDWLRVCDVGGWCDVRFDYTLAQLATVEIEEATQALEAKGADGKERNGRWEGRLLP